MTVRETLRQLTRAGLLASGFLGGTSCASPPPATPSPAPEPVPACPAEMVEISAAGAAFCIDRYEAALVQRAADGTRSPWPNNRPVDGVESQVVAVSQQGSKPQGYISGAQAASACEHAGKRLCSAREWLIACRGPNDTRYPYGDTRQAGLCNDRFDRPTGHPVQRLFRETQPRGTKADKMWSPAFMNDPRLNELPDTVAPSGAFPRCTNAYGVFDMVGNLHEWVADPEGTFLGGYFMDTLQNGPGCQYRTRAHGFTYHDYSTGFRCCSDRRRLADGPLHR